MATLEDSMAPRKRIATYGKAARRRIPDYTFASFAHRSQKPEVKQSESLPSNSPTLPAPTEPTKVKSNFKATARAILSKTVTPASEDIFDVPPSDDEAHPTPRPTQKAAKKSAQVDRVHKVAKEDVQSRKRVKLSPVCDPIHKPGPSTITKPSFPPTKALPLKQPPMALERAHTATVVARPKPAAQRKIAQPRTPRKLSPVQKSASVLNTPSHNAENLDCAMGLDTDHGTRKKYISPRGIKMWNDLLDPVEDEESCIPEIGMSTTRRATSPPNAVAGKILFKSAGVSNPIQRNPRRLPRRRLIDSLVEQAPSDDEMREGDSDSDRYDTIAAITSGPTFSVPVPRDQSLAPESQFSQVQFSSQSQSQGSQIIGPKFTYQKQRSMLAEDDFMKQLELDMPLQAAQPSMQKLQSFHEQDDEDDSAGGIRSIHELRQAGANSRFLNDIDDLLEHIGSPNPQSPSMRRSGLLDLASRLKDKNFSRQFRSNGVESRLFVHMGRETDLVAGFLLVSVLMALLGEANIMPHVVTQLRTQGIARLIIRLLDSQTSISLLAKDRKSNMSKNAQSLLVEHADHLLTLPIWEELKPTIISPRMVALKCLELMVRQTREAGNAAEIISKELTTKLFSILSTSSDEDCWNLPSRKEAVDFYLAISALESHSIVARTLQDENIWISDYLPIIADTLEFALSKSVDDFGVLQYLVLRLTLNVTNNNPKASDMFARRSLMAVLGQVIVKQFKKVLRFLTEEDFSATVEHLVASLGVMINFGDLSSTARDILQSLEGSDDDPLDNMMQLFVENKEKTSMAESFEESQKNVAFGYLAIALGYLSMLPAISERVRNKQAGKTLRPIIASIQEFIGYHKTVDLLDAQDGHNATTGLTERLESLVNKLQAAKAGRE